MFRPVMPHCLNSRCSGRRFFRDIRRRTVFAYYTSRIGIHDEIQYKGKTPLPEWVGCTHPEHRDDDGPSGDAA